MDFKEVKELIEIINSSNLSYFEYETNSGRIKMDKSLDRNVSSDINVSSDVKEGSTKGLSEEISNISVNVSNDREDVITNETDEANFKTIISPMVGTFYSSPSPDRDPFVSEGDNIKAGDNLCIIEAMKLMNEIESEVNGLVAKILVKDGDMVEFGQPLFKVKEN